MTIKTLRCRSGSGDAGHHCGHVMKHVGERAEEGVKEGKEGCEGEGENVKEGRGG